MSAWIKLPCSTSSRDPVRELVVAAGGRLQLERIRQEQGRGESRLGVAVACPVEMSES